jgi:acyl-CoA reductase-like NAD-dependent aldehyde dehydrogenase
VILYILFYICAYFSKQFVYFVGAKVLSGGFIPGPESDLSKGSFYPPTVLADVPENAIIAQEEIFGPIMCIFKVS